MFGFASLCRDNRRNEWVNLLNGVWLINGFNAFGKRATKVPIAGAATMLKNGACGLHRSTIGLRAYTPKIKKPQPLPQDTRTQK